MAFHFCPSYKIKFSHIIYNIYKYQFKKNIILPRQLTIPRPIPAVLSIFFLFTILLNIVTCSLPLLILFTFHFMPEYSLLYFYAWSTLCVVCNPCGGRVVALVVIVKTIFASLCIKRGHRLYIF